ncbi:MAG: endonuclease domain-containing protein [Ignavibacteriae bacterium]|nr:endonuclease domain-containing protein [Ignavibacteriota bacterium]
MTQIFNKKTEKEKRRKLRNKPTHTEKILWFSLRKKQIHSVRFLRQYSINHFVLDFYSPKIKLAIEVDGSSHVGNEDYDLARQKYIESFGIKVIRFTDEQVSGNVNNVIEEIKKIVAERVEHI